MVGVVGLWELVVGMMRTARLFCLRATNQHCVGSAIIKLRSLLQVDERYGQTLRDAMSASVSDQELGDSLLHSVESGSFPQSEHLASAPVGSEALPKLRQTLEKARDDTKVVETL